MKFAIVYFSETGRTEAMAHEIEAGIRAELPDAQVDLIPIADYRDHYEAHKAVLEAANGVILGTPVYGATVAWQVKCWLDTCGVRLGGKLGGAFATANFIQGGCETALEHALMQMLVKGMVLYSGGAACGKPYIHLGPVCIGPEEQGRELFPLFGRRFAAQAARLFGRD
ncbi:MAG: NAD(P)H-dependent oxidoreductase [Butyricicoccus sp.]|nr:NAD(P)H-dependent oxidoreductase [Butyricicoccus sp.]